MSISKKKWFVENVLSLLAALFLVLVIRSSVIEAFKIPSGSMIPTLLIGDHIFVNKFAYGFKVPFTDWVTKNPVYFVDRDPPKRGDIIVFKYPQDESKYFIKRVVGVPGDIVELKKKQVFINGKANDRTPLTSEETNKFIDLLTKEVDVDPKSPTECTQYKHSPEDLRGCIIASYDLFYEQVGDKKPVIMLSKRIHRKQAFDYGGPQEVPENSYFVLGDNRDNSQDSRYWGYVPIENVRGKALVIWLSLWIDFSNKDATFRPFRTGSTID